MEPRHHRWNHREGRSAHHTHHDDSDESSRCPSPKLGIPISEREVSRLMPRAPRKLPSQSVSRRRRPEVFAPRPRRHLRRGVSRAPRRPGIEGVMSAPRSPRQKSVRRAIDRIHPPRLPRPRDRPRRTQSAPIPHILLRLLPPRVHASVPQQGQARPARGDVGRSP